MVALYTIAVVLFLFGITIFIHELGHFVVARWCGMVVDVFSIGFGPAIWKKKVGDVTYKIGVFPFGGYVALPQMDPTDMKAAVEEDRDIPRVAPWKKILVALAGVTGNMILAILLAYIVYWVGKPSSPRERNCVVGYVETNSAAYAEGLRIGDEIKEVNGADVANWDDLAMQAALSQDLDLTVESHEGLYDIHIPTAKNIIGILAVEGVGPVNFCDVGSVFPGSSADTAGILSGDRIIELDGTKLYSREHLIQLVDQARDTEIPIVVLRGDERVELRVTPKYDDKIKRALIGVGFSMFDMDYDSVAHPKPSTQLKSHATAIFRVLKALMTPKQSKAAAQGIGGPVAILVVFWWAVQKSIMIAIWFTCFINVNLAVLNLLPIPILDGGHIVFALWEMITRRPVSARLVSILMNVFFVLLITVFIFLSYRDIVRLILPRFMHRHTVEQPAFETNDQNDE